MKARHAIALASAAAALIGMAVQELHADAKPPVHLVGEVDVTNMAGYSKEYSPMVRASVKHAGGHVVAFGSAGGSQKMVTLEGVPAKRVFIQVWDNIDQMNARYNSKEYKEARAIGDEYATFRQFVVDGVSR